MLSTAFLSSCMRQITNDVVHDLWVDHDSIAGTLTEMFVVIHGTVSISLVNYGRSHHQEFKINIIKISN